MLDLLSVRPSVTSSRVSGVLLLVLVAEVPRHEGGGEDDKGAVSDVDAVSLEVSRLVCGRVDEGTDNTTSVTDGNNDGGSDTLLERAAAVVGSPGNDDGNKWVDTSGGEEHARVVDSGDLGDCEHDETESADGRKDYGNNASLLQTVRHETGSNCGDGGQDIRRSRHLRERVR